MAQLDTTKWRYLHGLTTIFSLHEKDFFLKKVGFFKHWKEITKSVQSQDELIRIDFKIWSSHFSSMNSHLHYTLFNNGNVNIFSQYVTQDKLM